MILLIVVTILDTTLVINDSSGLTFTQRLSSYAAEHELRVWEYFAIARFPLKSDNITIIASQCCFGYLIQGMQVVAVHGANTKAIYDPNPSIPATVSCPGPGCGAGDCYADWNFNPGTCSATIETSNIDFVIAATAINDAPPCGGYTYSPVGLRPPLGFTNVSNQNNRFEVDYAITTTPQSNVVFSCHGTDAVVIMLDAVSIHDVSGNIEDPNPQQDTLSEP